MSSSITETHHYLPILIALKAAGGKSELGILRETVANLLRADHFYRNTASGPKTMETQFEKDFNWAGKRLVDAGLVEKLRTHWALTPKASELSIRELLARSSAIK